MGQAFEQVSRMAKHDRFALILDEFTYLMALEQGIAGVLQNAWDHHLKNSNIFLIISGSHLGMMERGILAYQAPLYGRAPQNYYCNLCHSKPPKDFFQNITRTNAWHCIQFLAESRLIGNSLTRTRAWIKTSKRNYLAT